MKIIVCSHSRHTAKKKSFLIQDNLTNMQSDLTDPNQIPLNLTLTTISSSLTELRLKEPNTKPSKT